MPHFFLLIFIFLSNFSCFLDNSSPNIINNYLSEADPFSYLISVAECVEKYVKVDKNQGILIPRCIINKTRGNEESFINFLKNIEKFEGIFSFIIQNYDTNGIMRKIFNFFIDDAKNGSVITDGLYSILNATDSSEKKFLDYVYNILDEMLVDNAKSEYIIKNASYIFNNFNTIKFYNQLKENHSEFIVDLFDTILKNSPGSNTIYEIIRNNSGELHDEVVFLVIDVIINFMNETKSLTIIGDFLYNHTEIANQLLKKLLIEKQFKDIINHYFNYEDIIIQEIIDTLLEGGEGYELFFELFKNKKLIKNGITLVINFKKNKKYVENNLASYL